MKHLFVQAILGTFILFFSSCHKNSDNNTQGGYVDVTIYLNEPSSFQLNTIGGWMYYTGGLKGLIVYRRTQNDFAAYDRECTYDPTASCALLKVESSNTTVADSCCGSRFNIYDGSVAKGPATKSMIQYQTTFDGNQIHIFN